jgi:Fe-Mn family superoxide dismutase
MDRRQAIKTLALGAASLPLVRPALAERPNAAAPPPAAPPAATGPFELPPLGYAFDALEPHLDAQTMQIHHDKHHAAYVTNLNKAVAGKPDLEKVGLEELLRGLDTLPAEIRTAVRNHGGGHANHSLLWTSLRKGSARAPRGELAGAIDKAFGSFEAFQTRFNTAALAVFGSGWAWLTWDQGALAIEASPNQDSPLMAGKTPLLGIDVWEHAYYLKFQNRRADYIGEFAKVVDWDVISARYERTRG